MSSSTLTLTHSLAHDPRTTLEMWLEEAETVARNLCPQHDPTGALTLVATDVVWREMPGNITNPPESSKATRPNTGPAQYGIYLLNTRTMPPPQPCRSTSKSSRATRTIPWLKAPWQGPYWLASAKPTSSSSKRPTQTSKPTLSLRARSLIP